MKTLLIYNHLSGKGRIHKDLKKIEAFFYHRSWSLEMIAIDDQEATNLIQQQILDYELILIAGGDGTVHSVISILMNYDETLRPKVMVLPYGTTNDVAHMLKIPKNINKALKLLTLGVHKKIDINKANDTYFVYAAAVGKFSKISYEINRKSLKFLGHLGYFLNIYRDLFNHYYMNVHLTSHNYDVKRKSFFIILVSGNRVGGFKLKRFRESIKLNDGLIGIRIMTRNHMFSWYKMIWFYLFKGKHFKNDLHFNVSEAKLTFETPYQWNIDGEKGPLGDLYIKVFKEAIDIYVHPKVEKELF